MASRWCWRWVIGSEQKDGRWVFIVLPRPKEIHFSIGVSLLVESREGVLPILTVDACAIELSGVAILAVMRSPAALSGRQVK
jgi:hypothetical protein